MYTDETIYSLNRLSLSELITLSSSLPPVLSGRVLTVSNSIESGYKWEHVRHGSYVKNASLISLSSWKHADRYVRCGIPGSQGHRNFCNQSRFCCFCSWKKSQSLLTLIAPAYRKQTHWYHFTVSHKSNVHISSDTSVYLSRFNRAYSIVQSMFNQSLITGAVASSDLSIPSLSGDMLFPHTHIIICSDSPLIDSDDTQSPRLQSFLQEVNPDNDLSLHFNEITSETEFRHTARYLVKAIDLRRIAEEDLLTSSHTEINQGLDRLLTRITQYEHKYLKIRYFGCLSPNRKDFCGKKKD